MPLYTYTAVRDDGVSITDEAMATDATTLRHTLEARGLLVLSLRKKSAIIGSGRASAKDFLLFNQEFVTLIKAGLTILQALEILQRRTRHAGLRTALDTILHDLRGGTGLSDAMALHPAYFPPLYTATVRAGEQSGALVDVLRRFIEYQKRMLSLRRKLVTALAYPSFLVLALIGVLALFFVYIIPNFTGMYGDQQDDLPFLTTMLISLTAALTSSAPYLIAVLAAAAAGAHLWQKTPRGRAALDALKLRIPLLRTLLTQYLMSTLTRTLATMLRGGIPLVQALDTTAGVISNAVLARRLTDARRLVTEGVSLAEAFERTRLAPDMTVRMIEVGESSGDLPQMLEDVSDFYEQEVENRLTVLTTMIEPVLMLTMGIVIAFIVVALYLPIFEMGARLK